MSYAAEEIGRQLLKARDLQGLTQRAFADKAGTSQARISKIENGAVDLRISSLMELTRNLDLEFVLVPRQHIPAVNAIISRQPLSSEEKALRNALTRLQDQVSRLNERFPDNAYLARLTHTARELSNSRLRPSDIPTIKKAGEALKLIEKTPALINTVRAPSEELRQLRNARKHDLSDDEGEPRAAYRLDENTDG